jgi:hypothetical protein
MRKPRQHGLERDVPAGDQWRFGFKCEETAHG